MGNNKEAKQKTQDKQESDSPLATLSTMLGSGESLSVANKKYKVYPLKLKEVEEFSEDSVNIGPQMFSVLDKVSKEKLDKWMSRQVFDANNEPVSLLKATEEDWDLSDLRKCVQMMIDISG